MIGLVIEETVVVFVAAFALAKAMAAAGGSFHPGPLDTGGPWSSSPVVENNIIKKLFTVFKLFLDSHAYLKPTEKKSNLVYFLRMKISALIKLHM